MAQYVSFPKGIVGRILLALTWSMWIPTIWANEPNPAKTTIEGEDEQRLSFDPEDFPIDYSLIDEPDAYETIVTGTPPHEEGMARVRIDRKEIAERGSITVAEVIEHDPAVYGQTTSKGERIVRLRGFDQRGVAVYLDGVPFCMPWDSSMDLGKIPAEMLSSALLLKGPTSIVHGPGGMGGALLLETREPGKGPLFETEFQMGGLERGSARDQRFSLYHGQEQAALGYAIGVGYSGRQDYRLSTQYAPRRTVAGSSLRNTNGTLDNSDRGMLHAATKWSFSLPRDNRLSAQLLFISGDFGLPRSETDDRPYYYRFNHWRGVVTQVSHNYEGKNLNIEEALFAGFYDNRLDGYDDATYSSQEDQNASISFYHDQIYGGRVRGQHAFRGLEAGNLYARVWLSTEHQVHQSQYELGGDDNALHVYSRTSLKLVPELEVPILQSLRALVSLETDLEIPTVSPDELRRLTGEPKTLRTRASFQPMLSLRYDPFDTVMVRLTGARRTRFPSLSERYSSKIGYTRANPDLKEEAAWYAGLEVDWRVSPILKIALSGFNAEVKDLIHPVYLPETNGIQQKQNVGRARLSGAEASVTFAPTPALSLSSAYAYLYARRLDTIAGEDRIAQIPTHQATFGLTSQPTKWVNLATFFRIVGPQAFDDYTILGLGELGSYFLWDAYASITPKKFLTLFLKATNLLDMNYQTKYGYPDRGVTLWIGVRVTAE